MPAQLPQFQNRREFKQLCKLVALDQPSLLDRHRIGQLVHALLPPDDDPDRAGGLRELTRLLGLPETSNALGQHAAFAREYTAEELQELMAAAPGSDFQFQWAHLHRLTFVAKPERTRLERQCRAGAWTVAELGRRIRAGRGRRRRGGPRMKSPTNLVDALMQVQTQAESFVRRAATVWLGGEAPAITHDAVTRNGRQSQRLVEETSNLLAQLDIAVNQLRQILTPPAHRTASRHKARSR